MFWDTTTYPFHVGIYPELGRIWTFNTRNQNVTEIAVLQVTSEETDKVSQMFVEIKRKINGKFGCACICLDKKYGKEIREKFIEFGKNCGFDKVEIIEIGSACLFDRVSKLKNLQKNGCVIWQVLESFFEVYKQMGQDIDYYGILPLLRCRTKEKLKEMVKKIGMEEVPNVILLSANSFWSPEFVKSAFPNCTILSREYTDISNGLIIKARLMAGEPGETVYGTNTINSMPLPYNFVICITDDNVLIYETRNHELSRFSSSIDYGLPVPKIGVNYHSSTVIKNDIKNFGTIPINPTFPVREVLDGNYFKQYYMIKSGNLERLITPKTVIIDLFKEVQRRINFDNEVIILTIPSHFSESQKEFYLLSAKMAGLTNFISVDEQLSLAFGYEKINSIPDEFKYILINFSNPTIKITVQEAGIFVKEFSASKTLEFEEFINAKNEFFDDILKCAINSKRKKKNNLSQTLEKLFTEITNLLDDLKDQQQPSSIVVTCEQFYYSLICNYFPGYEIIFVENPQRLILSGANMV